MKYFIDNGTEKVEVSEEEYNKIKTKVNLLKLLCMVELGRHPLTPISNLTPSKEKRFMKLFNDYMKELSYEEVEEQTKDILDEIFNTDPNLLPLNPLQYREISNALE